MLQAELVCPLQRTYWYRHLESNCSAQIKVGNIDMHKLHVSQLAMCKTLQDQAVQRQQVSSGQRFVVMLLCMAISASKDHQTTARQGCITLRDALKCTSEAIFTVMKNRIAD